MTEPIVIPSSLAEAIEGWVAVNGPQGLVFTLSTLVARDLAAKLVKAAVDAEAQRPAVAIS